MNKLFSCFMAIILCGASVTSFANAQTEKELDAYWAELSRTVVEGDFEGYSAGYHPDAILVSGFSKNSYPIGNALTRWKQGFVDTKAGKIQAGVEFIFTKRLSSEFTAHETGMFNYYTIKDGKKETFIAYLDTLMIKKNGKWLMMMEYQIKPATEQEWLAAKAAVGKGK